jgi:spermidine synthase
LNVRKIEIAVFLVSAVVISYQILLVKLFSIQYWHHFAYLIISIALLGFGSSGTFICLFRTKLESRLPTIFFVLPLLMLTALWFNLYSTRRIDFNPLIIVWQIREIFNLLLLGLALFIPFFLGALFIGLAFTFSPGTPFRIYCANLLGSGLGSLLILLTLMGLGPHEIILAISLLLLSAAFVESAERMRKFVLPFLGILLIILYATTLRHLPLPMSSYKDLSQAKLLRGAKSEREIFGPLGLVTVISSPAYHYLPDLSLNCPHPIPAQMGLFWDGNTVGAINRLSGTPGEIAFMGCRTASLAYALLSKPRVFVLGAGSGTEILNALYHGSETITAAEMNGDVARIIKGPLTEKSGGVYGLENVNIHVEEGRGFLQRTKDRYDLIQVALLESMGTASAGVYALNENYLFTREAFQLYIDRLAPEGILSVSRWIENPPRGGVKLVATAMDVLNAMNGKRAADSFVMIRSWQTVTILVKKGAFRKTEIEDVKTFCRTRLFDLCYYPGIRQEETNRFNLMNPDYFYLATQALFSGQGERFFRDYPFDVRPATDDRPFFSHTFRLGMMKYYFGNAGRLYIPYLDWGYILVWVSLVLLMVFSFVLIFFPLPFLGRSQGAGRIPCFIYFGSLGLAYMFIEMSFLQQFIRYLFDPVFSALVVIGSFLAYSGVGSAIAGRLREVKPGHVGAAVALIILSAAVFLFSDPILGRHIPLLPLSARCVLCSLLIAPLAVPMGIPFPYGLHLLGQRAPGLLPWAWGVNGFFSVIGAAGTILVAISFGFRTVVITALAFYVLAFLLSGRLGRR